MYLCTYVRKVGDDRDGVVSETLSLLSSILKVVIYIQSSLQCFRLSENIDTRVGPVHET